MKRILIICSGGLSTEIISRKLNDFGKSDNISFQASDIENAVDLIDEFDGVMITPQTKFMYNEIAKICQEKNKKVMQIPFTLYSPNPSSVKKLYTQICTNY